MARLPRPIRRFLRKFQSQPANPNAVNPQTVGVYPRASMRLHVPLPMLLVLIALAAVVSYAQVMQAIHAGDSPRQIAVPGSIGSLHSVFLMGGQVYIGTLESVEHGSVVLSDVFYLQSPANVSGTPQTTTQNPPSRGAQLVRRQDSDWHQPTRMSIPIDKILLMENVGRESIVARLIAEGRARQLGGQQGQ